VSLEIVKKIFFPFMPWDTLLSMHALYLTWDRNRNRKLDISAASMGCDLASGTGGEVR